MLEEANHAIKMSTPLASFDIDKCKKLKQFCSRRIPIFIHPSLYRTVRLTFPRDIGRMSQDESIKNEMSQISMEQVIGDLIPGMFVLVE